LFHSHSYDKIEEIILLVAALRQRYMVKRVSMSQIVIEDNLFAQLQRKAVGSGANIESLAHEAIQRYLQEEEQQKMQQEIAAYRDLHPALLQNFPGQYVAVYQGQLVDHDHEQLALYLRIRQHYPGEVVLIRQVRPEAEKSWTMRSPKFEYR